MVRYPQQITNILSAAHLREWTAEEKALVDAWLLEDKHNQAVLDAILNKQQLSRDLELFRSFDAEKAWERQQSLLKVDSHPSRLPGGYPWRYFFYMAASIVIILGVVLFVNQDKTTLQQEPIAAIQPGASQATIRLADGTVVALSDAGDGLLINDGLVYEDGKKVPGVTSTNFSSFEMSTPRGGQYRMTLPDGTKVWLNAETSLAYHENAEERHVDMTGEAYFEVAHKSKEKSVQSGEAKPFRISSNGQEISVLGTHFNVKSYQEDQRSYTTLLEGSVHIAAAEGQLLLTPGEQSIAQGNSLHKAKVDVAAVMAWKEGNFVFNSERLDEILRQVGRWYDVDFRIENEALKAEKFEVMVPRFGQLKELLELLQKTGKIKFRYEDRNIYVKEK